MHIEVGQATQNIASNTTRKLMKEQIDWLLNKNQERFILSNVIMTEAGNVTVTNMNALRTLIKTKEILADTPLASTECKAILPSDYSYLISDESKLLPLCGKTAEAPVSSTVNYLKIKFADSAGTGSPLKYYVSMSLVFGATTLTLADIKAYYSVTDYTGLSSAAEKFEIVSLFLHYIRNILGIEVYWEQYGDVVAPQSFIFPSYTAGSITVDGATLVVGTTGSFLLLNQEGALKWVPNRLTPIGQKSTMSVTPFFSSNKQSPISFLQGGTIQVATDVSFIVSSLRLYYIKKPRRMSLSLNQHCEIHEDFHQAICDLTVEYFKNLSQDPGWQAKMEDNMRRSPATI